MREFLEGNTILKQRMGYFDKNEEKIKTKNIANTRNAVQNEEHENREFTLIKRSCVINVNVKVQVKKTFGWTISFVFLLHSVHVLCSQLVVRTHDCLSRYSRASYRTKDFPMISRPHCYVYVLTLQLHAQPTRCIDDHSYTLTQLYNGFVFVLQM